MPDEIEKIPFSECKDYLQKQGITQGAVMNLGIDNLREINAIHGMHIGDEILEFLAELLKKEAGLAYVLRMESSDEFVVILPEYRTELEGRGLYARIQQAVSDGCREKKYSFTVSAGMVLFHSEQNAVEEVFSCAEFALNRAKENGKNQIFVYSNAQFTAYGHQLGLYRALQEAVEHQFEGFEVYYQPLVSIEERRLIGAEALIRWKTAQYPKISPGEFIPVLEQSGLIDEVGLFVTECAIAQQESWERQHPDFTMHINLSYVQFQSGNLTEQIRRMMKKYAVKEQNVVFEITESGFIGKNTEIARQLHQLKQMGFQLAMDDFGTGYSNFAYLKDFELDIAKMDRELIQGALRSREGMKLLKQVVNTMHSIDLKVCFEGVEQPEELAQLLQCNPEIIQGYVFGTPVPPSCFEGYFRELHNQKFLQQIALKKQTDNFVASVVNAIKEGDERNRLSQTKGRRLLLWMIPALFLTFIVIGVIYGGYSKRVTERMLRDNMRLQLALALDVMERSTADADMLAETLSVFVEQTYQEAEESDYIHVIWELVQKHEQVAGSGIWFEPYAFREEKITAPYIYKRSGQRVLTYYYESEEYNYFEQEYYAKTKERNDSYVTEPYFDPTMGQKIITFTCPIQREDGVFLGCISVDMYVDDISKTVKNLQPKTGGFTILLSEDGTIISGRDHEVTEDESFLKKLKRGHSGSFSYRIGKSKYDVYYDTMGGTGWKLVTCAEHWSLYQSTIQMLCALVALLGIMLTVTALTVGTIIHLLRRQNVLEYERQRNINLSQFKALRSSYHLILSVHLDTDQAVAVYCNPSFELGFDGTEQFSGYVREILQRIPGEDREQFLTLSERSNIEEILRKNGVISAEFRMNVPGHLEETEWIELSISPIEGTNGREVLYMIRDIDLARKKEQVAKEENKHLLEILKSVNDQLFRVGETDQLTGVYNRVGLEHRREEILYRAELPENQLFLMVADIDRLKKVNDGWGHAAGDEYIQLVACALESVRTDQMICVRIGGDEFVLFGTIGIGENPEELIAKLNEFLETSNQSRKENWKAGVSVGYFVGKPDGNREFDYYCDIADKKMYGMKQGHHDRT